MSVGKLASILGAANMILLEWILSSRASHTHPYITVPFCTNKARSDSTERLRSLDAREAPVPRGSQDTANEGRVVRTSFAQVGD